MFVGEISEGQGHFSLLIQWLGFAFLSQFHPMLDEFCAQGVKPVLSTPVVDGSGQKSGVISWSRDLVWMCADLGKGPFEFSDYLGIGIHLKGNRPSENMGRESRGVL